MAVESTETSLYGNSSIVLLGKGVGESYHPKRTLLLDIIKAAVWGGRIRESEMAVEALQGLGPPDVAIRLPLRRKHLW